MLGAVVVRNSDIWMHLATGRSIANGEYRIGVDPYTFTSGDRTWVNHSTLFDLGIYSAYRATGDVGVVLVRVAVAIGLFFVLISIRRPGSGLALPAVGAILAMVAANARLPYLQPTTFSYLFLAILIALLVRAGPRLPLWVALLTAVWANVDGWFVLAPVTVAIWSLNFLFARNSDQRPSIKFIGAVFAASLVGGLLNPHHVHAFGIPDELVPNWFPGAVKNEAQFRSYIEHSAPVTGAASYAFWVLTAAALTSFFLNAHNISFGWAMIFCAFGLVSLFRWRFVPFFAVAVTPIAVLNFQDFARRSFPQLARMIGIALRSLAVIGTIALCLAAWPGWLGPRVSAERAYRVGLRMVPDESLARLASQVHEWMAVGKLSKEERVFSTTIEMSHYLAWHAPGAKSFIDSRWALCTPVVEDYVAARNKLVDADVTEAFFRKHNVTTIVAHGSDENVGAARVLWSQPERYPFRAIAGRATLFGRCESPGQDPHPEIRLDPARLAFGTQEQTKWASPTIEPAKDISFWQSYSVGPAATPIELAEGNAWLDFMQAEFRRQVELTRAWGLGTAIAFGTVETFTVPAFNPLDLVQRLTQVMTPSQLLGQSDLDSRTFAGPILAIRALRHAQLKSPDDARPPLSLADAYQYWAARYGSNETNLVRLQRISALQQAHARLLVAPINIDSIRSRLICLEQLAQYHIDHHQLDLAYEAAKEHVKLMALAGAPQDEFNHRSKMVEQVEQQLREQRNRFETAAEHDQGAMRFRRAIEFGLAGEALNIVLSPQGLQGVDPLIVLDLMLKVGRAEEARAILHTNYPLDKVPAQLRGAYRWMRFQADAACGDHPGALSAIAEMITELRAGRERITATGHGNVAAMAISFDPLVTAPLTRYLTLPLWVDLVQGEHQLRIELHNALVRQGFVALQAGDTRLARQSFEEAIALRPANLPYMGQEEAALNLAAQQFSKWLGVSKSK